MMIMFDYILQRSHSGVPLASWSSFGKQRQAFSRAQEDAEAVDQEAQRDSSHPVRSPGQGGLTLKDLKPAIIPVPLMSTCATRCMQLVALHRCHHLNLALVQTRDIWLCWFVSTKERWGI